MAWQVRERRQAEEREKLEMEKTRLLGTAEDGCRVHKVCLGDVYGGSESPGGSKNVEEEEDRWLGERMREYFRGLDFIEQV